MAGWLSRNNWTPEQFLHADDINNIVNDIRNWGGNINGGGYTLTNVVIQGVSVSSPVASVFGRVGAVIAQAGDYTAAQVGAAPTSFQILAGPGLAGGGNLGAVSGQVTLSALVLSVAGKTGAVSLVPADCGAVPTGRQILSDATLTVAGGPTLSSDLTLSVNPDTVNQRVQLLVGGNAIATRHALNLISGANTTVAAVDNAALNRIDITVSSTGGAGGGMTDPTSAVGDLIVRGAAGTTNLPVGANGFVLTADSTNPVGVKWASAADVSSWQGAIGAPRVGAVVATAGDYTAAMVTNAVDRTQSYSDPAWITALAWSKILNPPAFFLDPTSAKGDLIVHGTAQTVRFPVGMDGQILAAASAQSSGLQWINAPAPGIPQSPWITNIDAASHTLGNVTSIGIGAPAPAGPSLLVAGPNPTILLHGQLVTDTCTIAIWTTAEQWEIGVGRVPGQFTIYDAVNNVDRVIIDHSGNVGLGIDAPAYRLDVVGDCNISGTYRVNGAPIGGVSSVFTRTGAVTAQTGDYTASQITNAVDTTQQYSDPAWITGLSWSKILGAPATGVASFNNRTGAVMPAAGDYTVDMVSNAVPNSVAINAGYGLAGGGSLAQSRSISVMDDSSNQRVEVLLANQLVGTRRALNFSAGAGVGLTVTDDQNSNQVDIVISSTGSGGGGGMVDPTTSPGDLIVRTASLPAGPSALPIGTTGQVLTVDLTNAYKVKWAPAAAGQNQSPWLSNINAANYQLQNVSAVGIGGVPASGTVLEAHGCMRVMGPYMEPSTGSGLEIYYNPSGDPPAYIVAYNQDTKKNLDLQIQAAKCWIGSDTLVELDSGSMWVTVTPTGLGVAKNAAYALDVTGDCNITGQYRVNGTPLVFVSSFKSRTGAVAPATGDYTAAMVTNAADVTQTYADPAWITSLAWSKITGAPAFLTNPLTTKGDILAFSTAPGRFPIGITNQFLVADTTQAFGMKWFTPTASMIANAVDSTQVYQNPAWIGSLDYSKLTNTPAAGGGQSPWLQNVNAANYTLYSVSQVGVGTAAPDSSALIHAAAAAGKNACLILQSDAADSPFVRFVRGVIGTGQGWWLGSGIQGTDDFQLYDNTHNRTIFTVRAATGYLGIGTQTPACALDVYGNVNCSTGNYLVNGSAIAAVNVLNAVDSSKFYADPPWLTALSWSKITGVPAGTGQTPWQSNIDGGGFNLSNVNVVTHGGIRPTVLLDQGASVGRARVFQAVAAHRLDLTANAYYDGTNWQRDDTTKPSAMIAMNANGSVINMGYAAAGTGAITTTNPFWFDLANSRLGIGMTSPGMPLDVVGKTRSSTGFILNADVGYEWWVGPFSDTTSWQVVRRQAAGPNAWTAPLTILTSGNVGIGTVSPTGALQIYASSKQQIVLQDSAATKLCGIVLNTLAGDPTQGGLTIQRINNAGTFEANLVTVNIANGNVGIGTTNPLNLFQVHVGTDQNIGIRYDSGIGMQGLGSYNDAGTLSGPMAFNASKFVFWSGNVGIGTTNPSYLLTMVSGLTLGSTAGNTLPLTYWQYNANGNNAILALNGYRIVNGTGWITQSIRLQASIDASPMSYIDFSPAGNALAFGNGTTEQMRITSSGTVGINTASPPNTLTILPTANPSGVTTTNLQLRLGEISNNSGYGLVAGFTVISSAWTGAVQTYNGGGAGALVLNPLGGSVGINTSSPTAQFEVNGLTRITGSATAPTSGGGLELFYTGAGGSTYIQGYDRGAGAFIALCLQAVTWVSTAGSIGVRTGAIPTYYLQVGADSAAKPTTNTWTVASDIRLKKDIRPVTEDALDIFERLLPKWIRYRYNGLFHTPDDEGIGIAAHELREVVPEAVGSMRGKLRDEDEEETDILDMNIHAVIIQAFRAIAELSLKVKKLEAQLAH